MRLTRRHRGLTLIECLVSILILGLGILGAVQCLNAALLSNLRATRIGLATSLAQNALEDLRSNGGAVALGTTTQDVRSPELPGGQLTMTVADYAALANVRRVTVVVTWRGVARNTEYYTVETLVYQRTRHVGG